MLDTLTFVYVSPSLHLLTTRTMVTTLMCLQLFGLPLSPHRFAYNCLVCRCGCL